MYSRLSGQLLARACLKNAFWHMYFTVCGGFYPNLGGVAGYID